MWSSSGTLGLLLLRQLWMEVVWVCVCSGPVFNIPVTVKAHVVHRGWKEKRKNPYFCCVVVVVALAEFERRSSPWGGTSPVAGRSSYDNVAVKWSRESGFISPEDKLFTWITVADNIVLACGPSATDMQTSRNSINTLPVFTNLEHTAYTLF